MSSLFPSILVPLDGSHIATQSLGCATWLASRLRARLHILSATQRELPSRQELTRLQVPEQYWQMITLHQAPAYPPDAILAAATHYDVRLIVITSRGETGETAVAQNKGLPKPMGDVARAIIERAAGPVLLLPPSYREVLPWERTLVPLSGEQDVGAALALAVRLANALGLEIHVVHVANLDSGDESLSAKAHYADALYHEYPGQFKELVRRALPQCTPQECRRIVDVSLCHGDVVPEVLNLIEHKRISLIVVCWHGHFAAGRARVLRRLLQQISIPVLLVKPEHRTAVRLKVGEEME